MTVNGYGYQPAAAGRFAILVGVLLQAMQALIYVAKHHRDPRRPLFEAAYNRLVAIRRDFILLAENLHLGRKRARPWPAASESECSRETTKLRANGAAPMPRAIRKRTVKPTPPAAAGMSSSPASGATTLPQDSFGWLRDLFGPWKFDELLETYMADAEVVAMVRTSPDFLPILRWLYWALGMTPPAWFADRKTPVRRAPVNADA